MGRYLNYLNILLSLFCCSLFIHAELPVDSTRNDTYSLYYYRDRIDLQEDYLDNALQMFRIKELLTRSSRIDSIVVYAYASPEGSLKRNIWLSEKRAEVAKDYILSHLSNDSVLLPENIILRPMGENWEGLYEELENNYHLMNRDAVLRIMKANIPADTKKWRLQNLDDGYTYKWIIRHHMPALRVATWICVYAPYEPLHLASVAEPMANMEDLPPLDSSALMPVPLVDMKAYDTSTILAFKTNLLYDAATLLNYSIEVPITNRFSVLVYHQFPWWTWGQNDNEYCVRFLSLGTEAKWWFKPQPRPAIGRSIKRDKLMGHYVGLYVESGKWDFQWERSIRTQGEHWSVGLSYGYSMPLWRYFNLEFSLSVGYASIPYRKYVPSEDYDILWREPEKQGRWHYFGPTKAQISLVVPITMRTWKKGGKR